MKKRKYFGLNDNRGFSMMELIVVAAIMAILIGVMGPRFMKYVEKSRVASDRDALEQIFKSFSYEYLTSDRTPGELSAKYFGGIGSGGELPASGVSVLTINPYGGVSLTYNNNFDEGEYLYDALSASGVDVATLKSGGTVRLFKSRALRQAIANGGGSVMMRFDTRQVLCMWVGSAAASDGTLSDSCVPDEQFIFGEYEYH